jgi:hypothetical protein
MPPGLSIVSGDGVTDTIGAVLERPLRVEVRGSDGRAVDGATVRFTVTTAPHSAGGNRFTTLVGRTSSSVGSSLNDTTDSRGQAEARVRLGGVAAPGGVLVEVPALGFEAMARYTVLPGKSVRLRVGPADSAVYTGNDYTVRGDVVDRHGNPHDVHVTYSVEGDAVSISSAGVVTGRAFGRATIKARTTSYQATATVSVVPRGSLAAFAFPQQDGGLGGVVTFNADGSDFRWISRRPVTVLGPTHGPWPIRSIQGDRVAFVDRGRIMLSDMAGTLDTLEAAGSDVPDEFPIDVSNDGRWVYYTRDRAVWRVRSDGSVASQVSEELDWGLERSPSIHPIDERIVYETNRLSSGVIEFTLRTRDLVTGTVTDLPVAGQMPRWSPSGDRVAFVYPGRGLLLVNADGSDERVVYSPGAQPGFAWSPDGDWLVVDRSDYLEFLNLESGLAIPLRFLPAVRMPSWR